jgi:predicted esterase
MPRFFRRVRPGVFALADLARRTRELAEFTRTAAARYRFDPAQLYALGYSNGANIAASLLLTDGSTLAGGVLLRATLPFEPEQLPDLGGKPVLIAAGRADPYAPSERVEALADYLERAGAAVTLAWDAGRHQLALEEIRAARRWFAEAVPASR